MSDVRCQMSDVREGFAATLLLTSDIWHLFARGLILSSILEPRSIAAWGLRSRWRRPMARRQLRVDRSFWPVPRWRTPPQPTIRTAVVASVVLQVLPVVC